jgi:hypothetical protein
MIHEKAAAHVLLVGLGALAVFHVLMLLGVLPADLAWGGRVEAAENLILLEVVAFIVTILFAAAVAAKAGFLGSRASGKAATVAVWLVFGYFVLNVAANLASASSLERAVFAPVSAVFALLALRLALSK